MEHRPRLLVANHSGFPVDLAPGLCESERLMAVRGAVEAQDGTGVDVVTCGHLSAENPILPLMAGLQGLEFNPETRRVPIWGDIPTARITGPIRWTNPIFEQELAVTLDTTSRAVKVTMAGPYTLASLIQDYGGVCDSFGACIDTCARAMAKEVRLLANHGATYIQVAEPLFLPRPSDFPRLREALIPLFEARAGAQLFLALSGEGICPLYDWLQNLPIDGLCLDLVRSPGLVNMISDRETSLTLGLGMVDAESLGLESREAIIPKIEQMTLGISAPEVHIQPASTLCHLSAETAAGKLANLASLIRDFRSQDSPSA